jgi:hypothetical protein
MNRLHTPSMCLHPAFLATATSALYQFKFHPASVVPKSSCSKRALARPTPPRRTTAAAALPSGGVCLRRR